MNNKWIKILLVASLALNAAFAGKYILRKINPPRHQKPFHKKLVKNPGENPGVKQIRSELNLSKEQLKEVRSIIKQYRIDMLGYKQEILNQRIDIIESFSDQQFNQEDLTKKTAALNELENQLNLSFIATLVKINDLLDSQQRMDFLLKLSRNWFFIDDSGRRRGRRGRHE